ncbi:hypothetical protein E2C01_018428 [Portunus trituberculatus]|uniref:Uncharacterized protein n=1 Tax=Portunus trituberculatus TaxID=210409 RepID=A0A5B7DUG3_PORTR|nr:hypothetical protein [Portunus trituberculatus]
MENVVTKNFNCRHEIVRGRRRRRDKLRIDQGGVAILVFSVIYFVPAYWDDYVFPLEIQVLGWLILFSTVIMVPLGMIYALMTNSGCRKDLLVPTPDFCPAHWSQWVKLIESVPSTRYTLNIAISLADLLAEL